MAVTSVGTTTTTPSTTSTSATTASSSSNASTSTGTLSAAGVGSGLDVKGLVSQLMTMEQKPLNLLVQQEVGMQAKLSNLGTVKSAIAALQTAAKSLSSASVASYSANSSDSTRLTATATADASLGASSIDITQLAQPQKLVAAGMASMTSTIGSGTLKFTMGTVTAGTPATFDANPDKTWTSLTIDSSNNTLAGIRDAINASGAGVKATIVDDGDPNAPYRLTLTQTSTGAANSMKIEVTGDAALQTLLAYDATAGTPGASNLKQVLTAQDAKLTIDGVAISRATNTVSDAVPGVTLNLLNINKTGDAAVALNLQRDTTSHKTALSALVKAYNDTNSTIKGASAKGAVLQGDWMVLGLQSQIRSLFGGSQDTGGEYSTLSQLGVSFLKDGSLTLDSTKLSAALIANPDAVGKLTAAVANSLDAAAEQMLGATGPISSKTETINSSITNMDLRRAQMQKQLDVIQARYQKQFSALDTLLSKMTSTSNYLTQQLANLPKIGNNN